MSRRTAGREEKQDDKGRGREEERERSQGPRARVQRGKEGRDVVISFTVSHSGGNDLPNLIPARRIRPRHRENVD